MISSCSAWIVADDVAQLAGAAPLQRGKQRAVAAQAGVRIGEAGDGHGLDLGVEALVVADAEVAGSEQLVLDAEQRAAVHGEVATAGEAHRLAACRPVERLGDRRPPVDDHRLAVLVGDGQAADVKALHRALDEAVDAAEHERRVAEVEVGQAVDQRLVEHVAFVPGLERAAEGALVEITELPGVFAAALEAAVGEVDVRLFVVEVGVLSGHERWFPEPALTTSQVAEPGVVKLYRRLRGHPPAPRPRPRSGAGRPHGGRGNRRAPGARPRATRRRP